MILVLKNTDYFLFTFNILKYFGANPIGQNVIYKAGAALHYSCTVIFYLLLQTIYICTHPDGFVETIRTFSTYCYHIIAVLRTIHCFKHIQVYYDFYRELTRQSFDFEDCGLAELVAHEVNEPFKREELVEETKSVIRNIKDEKIKNARLYCFLICGMLLNGGWTSIYWSYITVLMRPVKVVYDETLREAVAKNEIPYQFYHFLDIKDSFNYQLEVCFVTYTIVFLTTIFLGELLRNLNSNIDILSRLHWICLFSIQVAVHWICQLFIHYCSPIHYCRGRNL